MVARGGLIGGGSEKTLRKVEGSTRLARQDSIDCAMLAGSRPSLAKLEPKIRQIWPEFVRSGQISAEHVLTFGPKSTKIGPVSTNLGQTWPGIAQIRAKEVG